MDLAKVNQGLQEVDVPEFGQQVPHLENTVRVLFSFAACRKCSIICDGMKLSFYF